jgi:hypothetical protein
MSKLPECDRCRFYAYSTDLVCAVHPFGVQANSCLDFRPNPNLEPEGIWTPEGVEFVDGELIFNREQFSYDGSELLNDYLTSQEKIELLDYHPMFTGRCPNCEMPFDMNQPPSVHWGCLSCDWIDDSV